ncbi:ABC transporter permease subunit [Aeropyrum camini]|uniref:Branched-chain amino acid ABC-type transporter n=1 Tax=Aeropyrum camini SY1 = JCM 12091 TaxID=1198449 RepID=U3TGE5_9CREN|nr:branched-chain amino acid ABC transporter [Aeropyrum camini]BAN91078.1 branched-chain amino acid ABC-type transporter [Aeropyrum camini SY1 = JCM 12091]
MQVTAATLLSGLINGVLFGSLLGVIAIGLTLIWGVMKVVNLAHGHAVVFGAMAAAFMVTAMGLSPIHALVLAGLVGVPLGAALYYISLHMIIGRIDTITLREEMATLMTTFGAGLVIYGSHFVIHQFIPPEYSTEPSIYWAPWKPPTLRCLALQWRRPGSSWLYSHSQLWPLPTCS